MSTAPTTGSTGGGGIDPNIAALCTGLNSADLASLAQAKDPASAEQAWSKLAADAPDAIKGDMQTIATYLHDAVSQNYTALQGDVANLQTAVTHIEAYVTANCHS
jgi:hypothetical protein